MSAQTVTGPGTGAPPADLTWLLHRAAQRMRAALDQVAQACGLAGVRDWIVLAALTAEPGRTQLALAYDLGLDKTTLTSLLDRLEAGRLIIRTLDPHDRRARIPELTDAGRRIQEEVTRARDRAEAELLSAFSKDEQRLLRALLTRLAAGQARRLPRSRRIVHITRPAAAADEILGTHTIIETLRPRLERLVAEGRVRPFPVDVILFSAIAMTQATNSAPLLRLIGDTVDTDPDSILPMRSEIVLDGIVGSESRG